MLKLKEIRNEADYEAALARVAALMDAEAGSPQEAELVQKFTAGDLRYDTLFSATPGWRPAGGQTGRQRGVIVLEDFDRLRAFDRMPARLTRGSPSRRKIET